MSRPAPWSNAPLHPPTGWVVRCAPRCTQTRITHRPLSTARTTQASIHMVLGPAGRQSTYTFLTTSRCRQDIHLDVPNRCFRTLYYYNNVMQSQTFEPMAAKLSFECCTAISYTSLWLHQITFIIHGPWTDCQLGYHERAAQELLNRLKDLEWQVFSAVCHNGHPHVAKKPVCMPRGSHPRHRLARGEQFWTNQRNPRRIFHWMPNRARPIAVHDVASLVLFTWCQLSIFLGMCRTVCLHIEASSTKRSGASRLGGWSRHDTKYCGRRELKPR